MQSITDMPRAVITNLRVVLTDIDDTLTTDGRLPARSYQALESLYEDGLIVVPITGRPAGWCDMIARTWPVTGVVGENGAMAFSYDRRMKKMHRLYAACPKERAANKEKLQALEADILRAVPGSALSADQPYRETDLAIDFCEDVPTLTPAQVAKIVTYFTQAGATAKVSSIHVNGWFGAYDKLSMTKRFVQEVINADLEAIKEQFVFCGDSPNDAPMFAYFPHACGVANVMDFVPALKAQPAWISKSRGGEGFCEIAQHLLAHRAPLAPA